MTELSSAEEAGRAVFTPLPGSVRLLPELAKEDHLFVFVEVREGSERGLHQRLEVVEGMKDLSIWLRNGSTWSLVVLGSFLCLRVGRLHAHVVGSVVGHLTPSPCAPVSRTFFWRGERWWWSLLLRSNHSARLITPAHGEIGAVIMDCYPIPPLNL